MVTIEAAYPGQNPDQGHRIPGIFELYGKLPGGRGHIHERKDRRTGTRTHQSDDRTVATTVTPDSITETSSLLWGNPSLCLASVLSFLWGLHLNFSLAIETTGSHVPLKSLYQDHATSMPGAAQTIDRYPLHLFRDQV